MLLTFRYIFGEIMYGGHITDFFDRRTNNTYLAVIFNESLLKKGELAPRLTSPDCAQWDYDMYANLVAKSLPPESPPIYGLHPNAEIGFLTNKAENIFQTILRLSVGSESAPSPAVSAPAASSTNTATNATEEGAGAPAGGTSGSLLRETLADLTKRFFLI
jgi:dynein heavy chain